MRVNYASHPPTLIRGGRAREFLYVSYASGQPKIYQRALNGEESKRLTFLRGNQLMPALSAKKDCIAFVSDILGNPEVFVQSFDPAHGMVGKPWQITSFAAGAQASPTFSPDGKKIAYVSNKDGAARIYVSSVADAGSSAKQLKPTLISKQNKENTSPVWSPDGTKIAYSAITKGVRQIWIYDFKSGREMQLTDGSGHKESPSWGITGNHLVFHLSTQTSSELYFVSLNQKKAVKITNGSGEKRFASWER